MKNDYSYKANFNQAVEIFHIVVLYISLAFSIINIVLYLMFNLNIIENKSEYIEVTLLVSLIFWSVLFLLEVLPSKSKKLSYLVMKYYLYGKVY